MIHQTHIDTRLLVLDQDLRDVLEARSSQPDHNDCRIYREGKTAWGCHIDAFHVNGERVVTSVLRVALALAGVHVGEGEEVSHSCGHTTGGDLCVNPDHLVAQTTKARRRDIARSRFQQSLRKSFPNRRSA